MTSLCNENLFRKREPTVNVKRHIPNLLSAARLVLAFAFPFLPQPWRLAALIVAALSEWLDGLLSRRWQAESTVGRMLDPVADKLFVGVMLVTYIVEGALPLEIAGLVVLRDLTVATACLLILLFGERDELKRMDPRWPGKITTALQFLFLLTLVIFEETFLWIAIPTIAASAIAAVDYVVHYWRDIRGQEPSPQG